MNQSGTEQFRFSDNPGDRVERVRNGWATASIDSRVTAKLFYSNLFKLDPSSRSLFSEDIDKQGRKLTQTLDFIIDTLEQPEILLPAARDLAVRHVAYGVQKEQYSVVGAALVETLKELLGSDFDVDDEKAWVSTYSDLSDAMVEAAYPK